MVSTLDILYIVLAFCSVILTILLLILGVELLGIMRDIRRISTNVEHIAGLIDRVAMAIFPGLQKMAEGAGELEKKVGSFLRRKAEKISKL